MVSTGSITVGIDLGGTFVDIAVDVGEQRTGFKVSGSPRPEQSFFSGVDALLEKETVSPERITRIIHGTTLTTNALLEGKMASTMMVTTTGFRDVLEIGRHSSPRSGNIQRWIKPQRPIPRNLIVEVSERMASNGKMIRTPTEDELRTMAEAVRGAEAVAVVLLNSVANPENEDLITNYLQGLYPEKKISKSYEVRRIAGEYERAMTTVINAALQPALSSYLDKILRGLTDRDIMAPMYLMGSDGGLVTLEEAMKFPVGTVMSGPAGGVQAASLGSALNEQERIVTLDVGGTSSDVARAESGAVGLTDKAEIGDFVMNVPIVEISTIGAGGGSIATVEGGRLQVGPESAGSNPGPVCYRRGGTDPTVTDAMLVVGWLPTSLAGDTLELDVAYAREVVGKKIAEPLGLSVEAAALGIIKIANEKIAATLRQVSLDRGHDPRDYALMAYGGGGALHAVDVAQSALMSYVLLPPQPGIFSAQGLLDAPLTKHLVRPFPDTPELDVPHILRWQSSKEQLRAELKSWAGRDPGIQKFTVLYQLEVQYDQQGAPLVVDVPDMDDPNEIVREVRKRFEEQHEERYSYRLPDRKVVVVAAHAQGIGYLGGKAALKAFDNEFDAHPGGPRERRVYTEEDGWVVCPILNRSQLPDEGRELSGPLIVEENTATLFVPQGASIQQFNNGYVKVTW